MERSEKEQAEYEQFKRNEYLNRQRKDSIHSIDDIPRSQFSDSNLTLFHTLLTDPNKRAKVLELLTQEGIVDKAQKKKNKVPFSPARKLLTTSAQSPVDKIKNRFRVESPSAQHRKRVLQKLESENSDSSESTSTESFRGTPVAFESILKGVIAYVEVRSADGDRSEVVKAMMTAMGASMRETITREVTHVIFKDGSYKTFEKARLVKAHLVSVLWLEACKKNKFRVPEIKYPALDRAAYECNVSSLCQSMQKDFDKLIKDEKKKRRSDIHFSKRNSDIFQKRRTTMFNSTYRPSQEESDSLEVLTIDDSTASITSRRNSLLTSDCDTSDSSISNKIIPSSQTQDYLQQKSIRNHSTIAELTEEESDSLGQKVKNSFELKQVQNIRSPESLRKNECVNISENAQENDSLRLHVTTTDESNAMSTKSRISTNSISDPSISNRISNQISSDLSKSSVKALDFDHLGAKKKHKTIVNKELNTNLITKYLVNSEKLDTKRRKTLGSHDLNRKTDEKDNTKQKMNEENITSAKLLINSEKTVDKPKPVKRTRKTLGPNDLKQIIGEKDSVKQKNNDIIEEENTNTISRYFNSENPIEKPLRRTRKTLGPNDLKQKTNKTDCMKQKINEIMDEENMTSKYFNTEPNVEKPKPVRRMRKTLGPNDLKSKMDENDSVKQKINEKMDEENTNTTKKCLINSQETTEAPKSIRRTRKTLGPNDLNQKMDEKVQEKDNETTDKDNTKELSETNNKIGEDLEVINEKPKRNTRKTMASNEIIQNLQINSKTPKRNTRKTIGNFDTNTTNNTEVEMDLTGITAKVPEINISKDLSKTNNENSAIQTPKTITKTPRKRKTLVPHDLDPNPDENPPGHGILTENTILNTVQKRRFRKLYNINQTLDEKDFNWEDNNSKENQSTFLIPPKKKKYRVEIPNGIKLGGRSKTTKTSSESDERITPKKVSEKEKTESSTNQTVPEKVQPEKTVLIDKTPERVLPKTPTVSERRKTRQNVSNQPSLVPDNTPKRSPKKPDPKSTKTPRRLIQKTLKITRKSPRVLKTQTPLKPLPKQVLENERRSTFEFEPQTQKKTSPKMLTQAKKTRGITCTRLHRPDVLIFQQIVGKLGGFKVEDEVSDVTTHLVAGQPSRTINMLRAIARGCWILRHEWLFKSLEAGKWIDEEEFEMTEYSHAVQKCRLERQAFGPFYSMDIFKDSVIYVCRSSTPRASDLEELVTLCGGTVVKAPRQAQVIVGEYYRYDNVICVSEKWILECISSYKKKSFKAFLLERKSVSSSS